MCDAIQNVKTLIHLFELVNTECVLLKNISALFPQAMQTSVVC